MKNLVLTVPLLALITVAACVDAPPFVADVPDDERAHVESAIAYGSGAGPLPDDVDAASHRIEYARLRARLLEIVNRDEPFADRDRATRVMLTEYRSFPLAGYLRQFAAVNLLSEVLDGHRPDETGAIAYYTDALMDEGSPEAALIHRALQRLESQWSDERIRTSARSALENAVAWAEKVCAGCSPDAKVAAGSMAVGRQDLIAKRAEVMSAALELQKLAGP